MYCWEVLIQSNNFSFSSLFSDIISNIYIYIVVSVYITNYSSPVWPENLCGLFQFQQNFFALPTCIGFGVYEPVNGITG